MFFWLIFFCCMYLSYCTASSSDIQLIHHFIINPQNQIPSLRKLSNMGECLGGGWGWCTSLPFLAVQSFMLLANSDFLSTENNLLGSFPSWYEPFQQAKVCQNSLPSYANIESLQVFNKELLLYPSRSGETQPRFTHQGLELAYVSSPRG